MTATPFQLESLNYQTDAVDAVVRVFDGTPKTQVHELAGRGIAMAVCSTSGAFATFATLTEQARSRRKKGDKAYQTTSCEAAQRQNLRW